MKADFYITYHHGDEMAARWIAAKLKQARFTTLSDSWDFLQGETTLEKIDSMFRVSRSVMVLISRQFIESLGDSIVETLRAMSLRMAAVGAAAQGEKKPNHCRLPL